LLQDIPVGSYDVILIDTCKGLDPLAINALAAANAVAVMVTPGRLEMEAIARMHEHVALVQDEVLLQSQVPLWYPQVENRKRSLLRFSIEVVI